MAKDKSKKNKGKVSDVDTDDFAKPSEAPAGGDAWNFASEDNLGGLFLITPLRVDDIEDKFHPGERKEIIVADIVHLNEKNPAKSEAHSEVWVFQGYLKGALRGFVGEKRVLGRLAKGDTKDRGNYPWILEDADKSDVKVAREYLEYINNPLNSTATSASGDEPKKSKKNKSKK